MIYSNGYLLKCSEYNKSGKRVTKENEHQFINETYKLKFYKKLVSKS